MADQTPIEAAARALRDADCTGPHHGTSKCPDRHCRDSRTLPRYRDRARVALVAALGAVDVAGVSARHHMKGRAANPMCACGWEPNWTAGPWIPQFDAHLADVLSAALLAEPECPVCGNTNPGGTPSCDCDAHRHTTIPEESPVD